MARDTLSITDNRSGRSYEVPINDGAIAAADLRQIKADGTDPGLMSYDPYLRNTAACRSAITFVDGAKGILRHRGYAIEDLAAHSSYLEVAYLIYHGELPTPSELAEWCDAVAQHYFVHTFMTRFLDGFRYDAEPMGVLISTVAALSTFFPDATNIDHRGNRRLQAVRLLGQVPTLAAFAHRRRVGLPYVWPDTDLSYVGNFLSMMFRMTELTYTPNPVIERALEVLFILHADHEQACSTTTMRCVGSAKTDPFAASAAAAAALYGRFHDEAYEAVLRMLTEIGTPDQIDPFLERVKRNRIEPPGFGHRVYRTYDPRARILLQEAEKVFVVTGRPPLFEVALELDRRAQQDPYFVEQSLYPIIDYYEAILYHAIGFPPGIFPVLFAMPRFIGWVAQWNEMLSDPTYRSYRPRQIYVGPAARRYVSLAQR
jgi:citrate synthase